MRAEQWCNSCGIAYWKLHSYPRSPSGPVLLAWMLKELQNELPFCYQVLPIGSILPSVPLGGWEAAQVRTWDLKGGSRGNFMLQHPLLLHWRSSVHLPSCHHTGEKSQNREKAKTDCQVLGKATFCSSSEGATPFIDHLVIDLENLVIDFLDRKIPLRNKRLQFIGLFWGSCSLLYFLELLQ